MIAIPEELGRKHLRKKLCKGEVLSWKDYDGVEQVRDAHMVILCGCQNDEFIFVRATAKMQHYEGPTAYRAKVDTVFLKQGSVSIFPKDTMLDLKMRGSMKVDDLVKLLGTKIQFEGRLNSAVILRIDEAVSKAVTLSGRDIKRILEST